MSSSQQQNTQENYVLTQKRKFTAEFRQLHFRMQYHTFRTLIGKWFLEVYLEFNLICPQVVQASIILVTRFQEADYTWENMFVNHF